jgi:hypothetical protein
MSSVALLEYFGDTTGAPAGGARTVKYSRVAEERKKREERNFQSVNVLAKTVARLDSTAAQSKIADPIRAP